MPHVPVPSAARAAPVRRRRGVRGTAIALIAAFAPSACMTGTVPIPAAARADLAALVGDWNGRYTSDDALRHGAITLRLQAYADSAYGFIVIRPDSGTAPDLTPVVAEVRFVRVDDGAVSGRLEPYRDPVAGVAVDNVFTGQLDGDEIAGQYTITAPQLPRPITGRWQATRRTGR